MKLIVIQDFIDSSDNNVTRRINDIFETNNARGNFLIEREFAKAYETNEIEIKDEVTVETIVEEEIKVEDVIVDNTNETSKDTEEVEKVEETIVESNLVDTTSEEEEKVVEETTESKKIETKKNK